MANEFPPRVISDLSRGITIGMLSDSKGNNAGSLDHLTDRSVLAWMSLYSGGRLLPSPWVAYPGITSGQSINPTPPQVGLPDLLRLNPKPRYVIVDLGTNDAGQAVSPTTTIANLDMIGKSIRFGGMEPIFLAQPPRSEESDTIEERTSKINAGMRYLCQLRGYTFIDGYGPLVDPATGEYAEGVNVQADGTIDNVHYGAMGADILGKALAQKLLSLVPYVDSPLAVDNTDRTLKLGNALMLNGNPLPTNWTLMGDLSDASTSIEDGGDDCLGNWLVLTKFDGTAANTIRSTATTTSSPGDLIEVSCRLTIEDLTPSTRVYVSFCAGSSANTWVGGLSQWSRNVDPVTFVAYRRAPSGMNSVMCNCYIQGGTGILKIGQVTIRNLTALGLDLWQAA